MIETVELPALTAIGIMVEAIWEDLPKAVSAAWEQLFASDTGAENFLEVSIGRDQGMYRELVGYLAAQNTELPSCLVRYPIPAARYLRIVHDGPLAEIAGGFERLYAYAAAKGLAATDFKLDFGYTRGLPPGRHELHVALAAEKLISLAPPKTPLAGSSL